MFNVPFRKLVECRVKIMAFIVLVSVAEAENAE